MLLRSKPLIVVIAIAAMTVLFGNACRDRAQPGEGEGELGLKGEPDQYSATIVRTVDDGASHETTITREVRSGEQRREEWTEQGEARALIWRPDLGKCFLLDLGRRAYIEIAITPQPPDLASRTIAPEHDGRPPDADRVDDGDFQVIDRLIEEPLSPVGVENVKLPDEMIEGRLCTVSEQHAIFADGHTEITKVFRARDLGGLAVRVEIAGAANEKVITERRDVRIEVSADAFAVPANFKKVDKLDHK